jgi:hypothetical protein
MCLYDADNVHSTCVRLQCNGLTCHLQDMHAQAVMYEAVQVADAPADLAAAAAVAIVAAPCLLSSSGSSFAATAAGLGVAQQAAGLGLPRVQLDTPASSSTSPYGAAFAEAGLPGLAKTLAVEAGMSVLLQQQEEAAARIALQTGRDRTPLPLFSELDTRFVVTAILSM